LQHAPKTEQALTDDADHPAEEDQHHRTNDRLEKPAGRNGWSRVDGCNIRPTKAARNETATPSSALAGPTRVFLIHV
jgi:hypothetical protein